MIDDGMPEDVVDGYHRGLARASESGGHASFRPETGWGARIHEVRLSDGKRAKDRFVSGGERL